MLDLTKREVFGECAHREETTDIHESREFMGAGKIDHPPRPCMRCLPVELPVSPLLKENIS